MTYKTVMEILGKWEVEEYPFTPMELHRKLNKISAGKVKFFGDSFIGSFKWLYFWPAQLEKKLKLKKYNLDFFNKKSNQYNSSFKKSFLDKYFSYSLVAYGEKK